MEIFHGSNRIIESPKYGYGKTNNDYGRGFYCTENIDLAKEWACSDNEDGYSNKYTININDMNVLYLNSDEYSVLNWLAVLTRYRSYWQKSSISERAKNYLQDNFYVNVEQYDVVIGYRADDSYFTFAQDFVANVISLSQLKEAMTLGKLGEQVVLKSRKAFESIEYVEYEIAYANTYYAKKIERDRVARRQYRQSKIVNTDIDDIYMLDIMREGITNGDSRL